jgi:hypothetical protein
MRKTEERKSNLEGKIEHNDRNIKKNNERKIENRERKIKKL